MVPIFTPIPFSCKIVTLSKSMSHSDISETKKIFPAPPSSSQGLMLALECHADIQANSSSQSGAKRLARLGGLGPSTPAALRPVMQPLVRTWIPDNRDDKRQQGRWQQVVELTSTFTLTCAPTFTAATMSLSVRGEFCILYRQCKLT